MKKLIILVLVLAVISIGFYFGYLRSSTSKAATDSSSTTSRQVSRPGKGFKFTAPDNAISNETTLIVSLETTSTIFDNDGFGRKLVIAPHLMSRSTVYSGPDDKQGKYLAAFKLDMKLISSGDTVMSSPSVTTIENNEFKLAVMPNPPNANDKTISFMLNGLANMTTDNKISLYIKFITW